MDNHRPFFISSLYAHDLHKNPARPMLYDNYCKKVELLGELKAFREDLKKAKSLLQMDELRCRKRILRRLGYCTTTDVIEIKGRVACELSRYYLTNHHRGLLF